MIDVKFTLSYETKAEAEKAAERFEICNVYYTPFANRYWYVTVLGEY